MLQAPSAKHIFQITRCNFSSLWNLPRVGFGQQSWGKKNKPFSQCPGTTWGEKSRQETGFCRPTISISAMGRCSISWNEGREDTGSEQHDLLVSQPNADCSSLPLLPGKQQISVSAAGGVPAKGGCSVLEQQALHPTGHSAVGCHCSAKISLACVNATASCCSVLSTDAHSQVLPLTIHGQSRLPHGHSYLSLEVWPLEVSFPPQISCSQSPSKGQGFGIHTASPRYVQGRDSSACLLPRSQAHWSSKCGWLDLVQWVHQDLNLLNFWPSKSTLAYV